MKLKKTVTEVARNFSSFLNSVRYNHDTIVLIRGKKEVAELRPIISGMSADNFLNLIKLGPHLSESDLKSFSDDLKMVRETMNEAPIGDPWE
jgi:hypothetical protein|tara:strand:+ start:5393 stop:5668 length:276 start_codon:yes stop_codon:yes gene_type:complete